MWPGFRDILDHDIQLKDQLTYLNFLKDHEHLQLQNENERRVVTEKILELLGSPLKRYAGLRLWDIAVSKCELYIMNWGPLLRACLQVSTSSNTRILALKILTQIVVKHATTSRAPAFQQEMPNIMVSVIRKYTDNQELVYACKCLVMCIEHLPGISASCMTQMEDFVLMHLYRNSNEVIEALSDLFTRFPKCNEFSKKQRCSFSDAWKNLFTKTVNTLDFLFQNIVHIEGDANGPIAADRLPIFTLPCDLGMGIPNLQQKVRVFTALGRCLAKLMCSESPQVQVEITYVLELIKEMMSFPEEEPTPINLMIYPKVALVAFMLLEAIVLNFSVVEHTENIVEVSLKATSCNSQEVKLYLWKFLNIWMRHAGCTVSCKIVSNALVGHLLCDINTYSKEEKVDDSELKRELCSEALKVLNILITSACNFFEEKNLEFFISALLRIVRQVQLKSHPLVPLPLPYVEDSCRAELYKLLAACCMSQHALKNKCISQSIKYFRGALKDCSVTITNLCQEAINHLVHYSNPKKPPPDYIMPVIVEPSRVGQGGHEWSTGVERRQNYDDDDDIWQSGPVNGQSVPVNNVYPKDGEFQEAVMDVEENSRERLSEQDSSPHYVQLGQFNHHYNNSRTVSRDSSLSEDVDEESGSMEEEEEEVVVNEDSRNRPSNNIPGKLKHSPIDIPSAQNARPNIQMLEARRTTASENGDSSDPNVLVIQDEEVNTLDEDVTPVASPKRFASSENGGRYQSSELPETEEFDDEEEDGEEEEEEEEDDGPYVDEQEEVQVEDDPIEERSLPKPEERMSPEQEDRLSPEEAEERDSPDPEDRPAKKQRLDDGEEMISEDGSNQRSADCEEVDDDGECQEENDVDPLVNGEQSDECSSKPPTVEEIMSTLVLEPPPEDS